MPDIDASIPLRAGQGVAQPINYLTLMGDTANIANAQQNLLTSAARAAAGRDFQHAIGPDGRLDGNLLNRNLANDPMAARAAVETSQAGKSNLQTTLQNLGMSQEQGLKQFQFLGDQIGGVLATGKPVSQSDVQNIMAEGVRAGIIPVKDAAEIIGHAANMSPDELTNTAKQWYAGAQHGAQQLTPHVALVNNGQQQVPVNTNAMAGPVGPMEGATGVQNLLSPQDLAEQVPGQDANGVPILRNKGQILALQNDPTREMADIGNRLIKMGVPPDQVEATLRSAKIPGVQAAGVANGPAPGVTQAAVIEGTNAGNQGAALINDMASLPQQRAALQQVASEINSANPGPLNDQLSKIGGVLTQLGLSSDQATASQLMHKASALNALSAVSSGLGVPTDGKMAQVMAATPNGEMTPEAARAATGMLQGLLDYKQAKGEAWQQYQAQHGAQSFAQFQTEWNKNVPNAAAFQFNHLPAAEQTKYWSSLDKSAKQQLLDSMRAVGITPTKNGR